MYSPGEKFGDYVIEEAIAGGGVAQVYRARHATRGTVHGLKILVAPRNAEILERFLAEGRIAATLDHPHIVRVSEVVEREGAAALVMDYVDGPDLDAYLRTRGRPLAPDEIHRILLPVLDAVGEAHRRGVIHRDLKPMNVLLDTSAPGGPRPMVTDFGLAKVGGGQPFGNKAETHSQAVMGTPGYMSPEQVRSSKTVTMRSDIFSLGATLYRMATGRPAFDGADAFEVIRRIVDGEYTPARGVPGLDPAIAAAIDRALDPDPDRRFATCAEFARALAGQDPPTIVDPVAPATILPAPEESVPTLDELPGAPAGWSGRRIALAGSALFAVGFAAMGIALVRAPSQPPAAIPPEETPADAPEPAAPKGKRSRPPPAVRPAAGVLEPSRYPALVRERVQDGLLAECEQLAAGRPGVVLTRIVVAKSGRVAEVRVEGGSLDDRAVKECIARLVRTWSFPSDGTLEQEFSYAFSPGAPPP